MSKQRQKQVEFQPYYKNQSENEREIVKLLNHTDWTYAKIGKKLHVSDHSVTDTNKKFGIRPRKPTRPRTRPGYETWRRNHELEAFRNKKRRKGLEEVERLRKEGKSPFYTMVTTENKKKKGK